MAPPQPSRRSSKSSIISVDPVVASQITGTAKSTGHAGHARTESTPARVLSTPLSAASKTHARTNSVPNPNRNLKKRSNSLRKAKNSTELLKLRSALAEKASKSTESSTVNRGRNFTVSNVSTGGLLHLSPSPHQVAFSPPLTSPSPLPWLSTNAQLVPPTTVHTIVPTQFSHARTRSVSPKRLLGLAAQSKTSKELARTYKHNRSQSFSTLDESRKSVSAVLQPQTLKIVINRPDSVHSSEEEEGGQTAPTLQIPIPHYKLGTPRFSAHGTPFIRGSFNHGSGPVSTNHSSMTDAFGGQFLAGDKQFNSPAPSGESLVPVPGPLRVLKNGQKINDMAPISPNLYDRLLAVYDDPSVVRYANNKRDIAAATKIRIIAQISSESFMDYDLVSDFFLTFRSYMTTFEVIDYLLARLRWSVARLSDDGRIIRIRTFAALRHWILNYFAEDFVVNRHLRVRFCDEINELYEDVRQRPRGTGGVSDLKILQDLKRCWNGRCALYWDAEEFNMDSNQEDPLLPGGVLGSRNPQFADISEATAALGLGLQNVPESLPSPIPSTSSRTTRKTQHKRLPSSDYAKKPMSVESESSVQPTSCSLPRYHSRSPDKDTAKPGRAPQPVSVLSRRQNAPSDLKVQVHTRPDSQDDEAEQVPVQTPVEALVNSGNYMDPHAGSMIRGFVYGPVEPFIQLPLNPPLSPSVRFSSDQRNPGSSRIHQSPQTPTGSPAVKNIFGSIRRALSGKQGSNEVTLITTVSNPRALPAQSGKRSAVPVHLERSSDDLRRKAAGVAPKTQVRIDLLCAAAVQSFQAVVPGAQSTTTAPNAQRTPTQRAPFSPPLSSPTETRQHNPSVRLPSHCTARSGSILIVDDTAVAMPVMSGALLESYVHDGKHPVSDSSSERVQDTPHHASSESSVAAQDEDIDPSTEAGEKHQIGIAQSSGLAPLYDNADVKSRTSSAVTVRKLIPSPVLHDYEPEDSVRSESLRSTSPPSMTEGTSKTESPVSKAPAHGLRRRPGGDLKRNENVHEMETHMHHESLDSMLRSSSLGGSLIMNHKPSTAQGSPVTPKNTQKVSMIDTKTSQHLRPSFAAAISDFSAIPDEDDGGLEATLLKLEGRYVTRSPELSNASASPTSQSFTHSDKPQTASTEPTDNEAVGSFSYGHPSQQSGLPATDTSVANRERELESQRLTPRAAQFGRLASNNRSGSEASEVSLPIMQSDATMRRGHTGGDHGRANEMLEEDDEARSSSDILEAEPATEQHSRSKPSATQGEGATSFPDDEENISDLSSEISVDIVSYSDALGKPMSPMLAAPGTAISGLEIPSHPLTHASVVNLSLHTSPNLASNSTFVNQPPTPQQSPLLYQVANSNTPMSGPSVFGTANNGHAKGLSASSNSSHLPFILACSGEVLAQQLTIVEQSALTEIEWTDLVEMRWTNNEIDVLDWAEYMAKHDDARGIDVVVTRFNLVTKWALSEIVLTQDIGERARVISKLIHVAAYSRRLHNFATMLQIMIALMSLSSTRLKKTWNLVSGPDRSLYKQMERLANPVRNFHNLREEMENEDLSSGCIPFVGLYVHDLNWNAQKPAEIISEEGAESLINFDRFRTAAVIVKSLLRLIDASLRYDFEPIHGVIERCLWLSALTNERIDAISQYLET